MNDAANNIRVRIAPSPTGNLHIGTARTALFNFLFAKHMGGTFLLRIEDTDLERSTKEFEEDIIKGLSWLGIVWNEGPYRQSERLDIYEGYLTTLLKEGKAYYCACTKEELEAEKKAMTVRGEAPRYSGKCRTQQIPAEKGQVIRFNVSGEKISFQDLIRGEISFDTSLMGDIAIAKNLRTPLYNFAVVIDDFEMRISHVIRGEDHIANTPKQLLLQRALGMPAPQYAHLPLILDPDRSKMSKRYSATSIQEYKKLGYLPEALFNFIALLGWHPQHDEEILTKEALIEKFDIARIQKAGAIFDVIKLKWLNGHYIKKTSVNDLMRMCKEIGIELPATALTEKIIEATKDRLERLSDIPVVSDFFIALPTYDAALLIWKQSDAGATLRNLRETHALLERLPAETFSKITTEAALMPFAITAGKGNVLWPLRVALSGKDKSPGPFEILDVLGREESLKRIDIAISKLQKQA